jgi:hypothetical protein
MFTLSLCRFVGLTTARACNSVMCMDKFAQVNWPTHWLCFVSIVVGHFDGKHKIPVRYFAVRSSVMLNGYPYRRIMFIVALVIVMMNLGGAGSSALNDEVDDLERLSSATKIPAPSVEERAVLALTNNERRKLGLDPLRQSTALMLVARIHSQHMCDSKTLRHESDVFPRGWQTLEERLKGVHVFSGGENLAYHSKLADPQKWADLVVRGWMRSQEHKKNIFNKDYRFLGVGVGNCKGPIEYVTQVFSKEMGVVPSTKNGMKNSQIK